jgi:ferredoxin
MWRPPCVAVVCGVCLEICPDGGRRRRAGAPSPLGPGVADGRAYLSPMILSNIKLPEGSRAAPIAGPPTPSPEATAVARALDTPRITLREIGEAIGVSRFAMEKYRNGQRPLPPVTRIRLADYLEAHARQVQADADTLRAGG